MIVVCRMDRHAVMTGVTDMNKMTRRMLDVGDVIVIEVRDANQQIVNHYVMDDDDLTYAQTVATANTKLGVWHSAVIWFENDRNETTQFLITADWEIDDYGNSYCTGTHITTS